MGFVSKAKTGETVSGASLHLPGCHSLINFRGIAHCGSLATIETVLRRAATDCGATVLSVHAHGFGTMDAYTAVALLAESHISIHTWPELRFAAVDAFLCGSRDPACVEHVFHSYLRPQRVERISIDRMSGQQQSSTSDYAMLQEKS